ncbi:uncharacterized protein [Dysidea avara]|uniref:uncharacterized protein n=1 Tax=Dysidea avara TaxID=196820 RepID=UPI003327E90E
MDLICVMIVLMCSVTWSSGQTCIDDVDDVQLIGSDQISNNRIAIVPRLNFTCNGRITNIRVRISPDGTGDNFPYIQVWRQSPSSQPYNLSDEVQIQSSHLNTQLTYLEANIPLTGNNRIQFQSGDVIGFYNPSNSRYEIRDITTPGYLFYVFERSTATSLDLNNAKITPMGRQPLIQFTLDIRCIDLRIPSNGEITSCSSGSIGVGYEGDTCSFTCYTGYVLTGSDTRTCQGDRSWSGSDDVCRRDIQCSDLPMPSNGEITSCSSGSIGVGYEGDTCNFTCNTGYELTGSNTRTCQSDMSWSGSDVCSRVSCPSLTHPNNGTITCSLGDDGVPFYEDTCSFTCNTGYELTGSDTRTCQSDGNWSGSDDVCRRVSCPSLTNPNNGTINCSLGDDGVPSFEDTCSFTCNTGYVLTSNDTRTCQNDESWSGSDDVCTRVTCPSLTDPNNGVMTCSLGDDGVPSYENTCSFTCNTGYELIGSDTWTCQSDGSWSGSDDVCRRVPCPSLTDPNNGTITCSLGDDGVPSYEDTCSFTCNTGYELTGSDTRTCQSDGSWSGSDTLCNQIEGSTDESSGSSGGSSGAVIGGIIGGVVMAIVIIVVLVVVMVWMRRSRKNQVDIVDYGEHKNGTVSIAVSIAVPTAVNDKQSLDVESLLTIALAGMDDTYDDIVSYDKSKGIYYMSANEIAKSLQKEENIYETPYKHKEDCGPVYCVPADDEKNIYEEFAGKKFRKLLHKEIKIGDELGSGEFGIVARAVWKPSSRKKVEVAVKTLNANVSTKDRVRFLQEAAIMCQFDHLNVVKLHGVVTDEPVMIVLEYVSRGDLRNVLIQLRPSIGVVAHEKLPLLLLKSCQEIAAGMAYLSGKQFVHRDLAARNILVSESVTCKIADFGMSRDLLDENYYVTSGGKIPVKWTAPEAINYKKYSGQSDVWSYGVVLYEIWSLGCEPYEWLNLLETVEKVDTGYRLPPPPGCPRTIYRVMIKCWNPEPKPRPEFGQITQLLAGNHSYVLGWSDEDKQYGGEDAIKLGGHLESANNLYYDLQMTYKQYNQY